MTNADILRIAAGQSAIDCGCSAEDFFFGGSRVVISQAHPDARRYLSLPFMLDLVSYGSGIVASQKGANGGYGLAMDPEEISLGLIIERIDGPFELNHCLSDDFDCTRVKDKKFCQFHHIFDRVNAKLKDELYSIKMNTFKTHN
jgi:Rrf2 family protein